MFDRKSIIGEKLRLGVRSLFPSLEHGPAPSRTSKPTDLRQDKQTFYMVLHNGTLSVFCDYVRAIRYSLLSLAVLADTEEQPENAEQPSPTMYSVTCRCSNCLHYYHDIAIGRRWPHKPGKSCKVRTLPYRP